MGGHFLEELTLAEGLGETARGGQCRRGTPRALGTRGPPVGSTAGAPQGGHGNEGLVGTAPGRVSEGKLRFPKRK